jgi:hypothetical protein
MLKYQQPTLGVIYPFLSGMVPHIFFISENPPGRLVLAGCFDKI